MIIIPTRAIVIPTHTSPEADEIPAVQYFDIVYYYNTGYSTLFHSMTTAIALEDLEAHIEQMDELKVAVELHAPKQGDEKEIVQIRKQSKQAQRAVLEQISKGQELQMQPPQNGLGGAQSS